MRFFTPDLYCLYNSEDDDVADQAHEAWEEASLRYREHLRKVQQKLPLRSRALAKLNLHDAELLEVIRVGVPIHSPTGSLSPSRKSSTTIAIATFQQGERVFQLFYVLRGRDGIRSRPSPKDWPFSKERVHCMYDELDMAPQTPGAFLHRMLLSDGRIVEFPFSSVVVADSRSSEVRLAEFSRSN